MKLRLARSPLALFTAIASLAAIVLLTGQAQAACKGGFCTSGTDEGTTHIVEFTTTWNNVSHFNYQVGSGAQVELGANERRIVMNGVHHGDVIHYALQACSGGGTFSRSKCTPWAYFTHTVP